MPFGATGGEHGDVTELPDRDPLERDLLEVDDPLMPEELALHVELLDGEWVEGRDLTDEEIDRAHDAEVRRLADDFTAGGDGSSLR